MTDFRPISLCNAFYKIISKSMANIMKDVFPKIISPHQSVFLRDDKYRTTSLLPMKSFVILKMISLTTII